MSEIQRLDTEIILKSSKYLNLVREIKPIGNNIKIEIYVTHLRTARDLIFSLASINNDCYDMIQCPGNNRKKLMKLGSVGCHVKTLLSLTEQFIQSNSLLYSELVETNQQLKLELLSCEFDELYKTEINLLKIIFKIVRDNIITFEYDPCLQSEMELIIDEIKKLSVNGNDILEKILINLTTFEHDQCLQPEIKLVNDTVIELSKYIADILEKCKNTN